MTVDDALAYLRNKGYHATANITSAGIEIAFYRPAPMTRESLPYIAGLLPIDDAHRQRFLDTMIARLEARLTQDATP